MKKPHLLRLRYFLWLPFVLGIWLISQHIGIPYLRWSYTYLENHQAPASTLSRHYTRCTYIGLLPDRFRDMTIHPSNGLCPLIKLGNSNAL